MSSGLVAIDKKGNRVSLVKIETETDFAAVNELSIYLVDQLAKRLAEEGEIVDFSTVEATAKLLKETISVETKVLEFEEGNVFDTYIHNQNGRGVTAVAIEGRSIDPEILHQLCLHIAFAKPLAVEKSQISEKDLFVAKGQIREEISEMDLTGKPDGMRDKIAEGKLSAWAKERVLMEQFLFGDKNTPIKDLVGDGTVIKFRLLTI